MWSAYLATVDNIALEIKRVLGPLFRDADVVRDDEVVEEDVVWHGPQFNADGTLLQQPKRILKKAPLARKGKGI